MKKLNTVNVIEMVSNDAISQLFAFPDTPEGNKAAEKVFLDILRENKCEADETPDDTYLDQGEYDDANEYHLFIFHSTN